MDWFYFSLFIAFTCVQCIVVAFVKGANKLRGNA